MQGMVFPCTDVRSCAAYYAIVELLDYVCIIEMLSKQEQNKCRVTGLGLQGYKSNHYPILLNVKLRLCGIKANLNLPHKEDKLAN